MLYDILCITRAHTYRVAQTLRATSIILTTIDLLAADRYARLFRSCFRLSGTRTSCVQTADFFWNLYLQLVGQGPVCQGPGTYVYCK